MKCRIPWILVILSVTLATSAVAQQYTPRHEHGRNFTPVPADARDPYEAPAQLEEKECKEDLTLKRGQEGYMHCRDHEYMQKVFTAGNCFCSTGQCRATDWKYDSRSPVGLAFKIDGVFRPVNKYIDPKKVKVPNELRTEPGYVCIEKNVPRGPDGCPPMEKINCSIWNDGA